MKIVFVKNKQSSIFFFRLIILMNELLFMVEFSRTTILEKDACLSLQYYWSQ
jgi:hypothetical protein